MEQERRTDRYHSDLVLCTAHAQVLVEYKLHVLGDIPRMIVQGRGFAQVVLVEDMIHEVEVLDIEVVLEEYIAREVHHRMLSLAVLDDLHNVEAEDGWSSDCRI